VGRAGSGKSHALQHIVAEHRAEGRICLVSAATALAATVHQNGWTTHALTRVPVEPDEFGNYVIKMKPQGTMTKDREELIKNTTLMILDEGPSLNRCYIEAVIEYLRGIGCKMRLIVCGDFMQIPPVVPGKNVGPTLVVDASFASSTDYEGCKILKLTKAYRDAIDGEWAGAVLALGTNEHPEIVGDERNNKELGRKAVRMPLVSRHFHADSKEYMEDAIRWVFGEDSEGRPNVAPDGHTGRHNTIICTTNRQKDIWNEKVRNASLIPTGICSVG
jgi:hypothetical protein